MSVAVYSQRLRALSIPLLALTIVSCAIFITVHRHHDETFAAAAWRYAQSLNIDGSLFRLIIACLTYVLFMGCFLYWKMKITWIHPFAWDQIFAQWDQALLGGKQAWQITTTFLETDNDTHMLDNAYALWGLACTLVWFSLAYSKRVPRHVRYHYWLGTLMTWIIVGLVFATVFSSAGPIYYAQVVGDHAMFQGLRDHLAPLTDNLVARQLQIILWRVHTGEIEGVGGISAMPSMHNAQVILFVLVSLHFSPVWRVASVIFAMLIFVGSMHLGWHYMVDGLASFVLVPPIWYIAGRITGSSMLPKSESTVGEPVPSRA